MENILWKGSTKPMIWVEMSVSGTGAAIGTGKGRANKNIYSQESEKREIIHGIWMLVEGFMLADCIRAVKMLAFGEVPTETVPLNRERHPRRDDLGGILAGSETTLHE